MDKAHKHNLPEINHKNLQTLRMQLRNQLIHLGVKVDTQSERSSIR